MMENRVNSDVAKEFLAVLAYCDDSFVDSIPDYVLKKLNDLAADSSKNFCINVSKSLEEQDLSNECRDLLGELYFMYMMDSDDKKKILSEVLNDVDNL